MTMITTMTVTVTMVYSCIFLQESKNIVLREHRNIVEFFISKLVLLLKKQLAIILCTAGCNNFKLCITTQPAG